MGEPSPPPGAAPADRKKVLITAAVVVLLVAGAAVAWPRLGADNTAEEPSSAAPGPLVTDPPTVVTDPPTAAAPTPPSPSPTPGAPVATDTEAPDKEDRVTALHSELDELAVKKVLDYRLRDREPSASIARLGGEGERLTYRRKRATVSQVNGLFADSDAAAAALQRQARRLRGEKGTEVEFDEPLRDTGDNVIGRIISVLTDGGKRVVTWSNSNLLVTIGPGRPRLMERWYQALPY